MNTTEKISPNKWIVITNRKAGKRQFIKQTEFVKKSLQEANIKFDFNLTQHKGHAIDIAKENVKKGYSQFLILGGDGTINEVVNGIMKSDLPDTSHIKIAVIPRGTGNDWARFWNIKKDNKKAFATFLKGKTQLIDIGEVIYQAKNIQTQQHRYFINSIGFGLDAVVVKHVERYKKIIGSFSFLYTMGLLHSLFHNRYIHSIINIDNKIVEVPLYTMNIANGCYSGGGIKQNPRAIPYDHIFDMIIVGKIKMIDIIKILPNIFNGKLTENKIIQSFKGKNIHLKTNQPIDLEIDGILLPRTTFCKVNINPNALQMIVP